MKKCSPARVGGILLVTALVFLSACSLPDFGAFINKSAPEEGATVVAGEAIAGELPEGAEPESSPSEEAGGLPVGVPLQAGELTAADFAPGQGGLHGMIVFQSAAEQPFASLSVGAANLPYPERQLWAFSPDGVQAGRISPSGFGAAILLPQRAGLRTSMLQYGLEIDNEEVDVTLAPEMCNADTGRAFDADDPPCGGFQFSPDRRYLAFFSGPDSCGRSLQVQDLQTGQMVRTIEGARWAYFQQNSTLMLAAGDCETVKTGLYIPHQNSYAGTGSDGLVYWNPRHTAALVQVAAQGGARQALWGFNLENSKVVLWMDDAGVMQDTPTWTPDGETFIFQHRRVNFDQGSQMLVTEGPRQIVRMNATTRSQQLLSGGGQYEYHLCTQDGAPCDQWYGDYVQVHRTRYRVSALAFNPETGQYEDADAARCTLFGLGCAEPAEPYALNWKTGELIPWAEADLVGSSPALASAPDFDRDPVYQDPGGAFSYYLGLDGRSLWRVSASGQETLWVKEGQDFLYLP